MIYDDYENENVVDDPQTHVHEVIGNVRLAELNSDPHNHQFAGVTGESIRVTGGHIHRFQARTDYYENHFHPISVRTGIQVVVGAGEHARHIHYIDDQTQREDGHVHEFITATFIENPIGD